MIKLKQIGIKISAVSLLFYLLFPLVFNFSHSLQHHEHVIECNDKSSTHLHEIEFDCSFEIVYTYPKILKLYDRVITIKKADYLIDLNSFTYTSPILRKDYLNSLILRGPPCLV